LSWSCSSEPRRTILSTAVFSVSPEDRVSLLFVRLYYPAAPAGEGN
jgi:hypothetical protein